MTPGQVGQAPFDALSLPAPPPGRYGDIIAPFLDAGGSDYHIALDIAASARSVYERRESWARTVAARRASASAADTEAAR